MVIWARGICGSSEKWFPLVVPKSWQAEECCDLLPLWWSFPSMLHIFLPCLGLRRLIHADYIMSGLSGLAHERLLQKMWRQDEHKVRVLFSCLLPCPHQLAVSTWDCSPPFSDLFRIPGNISSPPSFTPRDNASSCCCCLRGEVLSFIDFPQLCPQSYK